MPRPKDKNELVSQMLKERAALEAYLATLTPQQMIMSGVVGEWSVKDVLAHLTAWEQMCLEWYTDGKRGKPFRTPSEEFTWRQTPELNEKIYEAHRDDPLEMVLDEFHVSYHQMCDAVQKMTEEELFKPKYYRWTNSSTLGSYITSATASHYFWARIEIRKGLKGK